MVRGKWLKSYIQFQSNQDIEVLFHQVLDILGYFLGSFDFLGAWVHVPTLPVFIKISEEHKLHFPIISTFSSQLSVRVDSKAVSCQGRLLKQTRFFITTICSLLV